MGVPDGIRYVRSPRSSGPDTPRPHLASSRATHVFVECVLIALTLRLTLSCKASSVVPARRCW